MYSTPNRTGRQKYRLESKPQTENRKDLWERPWWKRMGKQSMLGNTERLIVNSDTSCTEYVRSSFRFSRLAFSAAVLGLHCFILTFTYRYINKFFLLVFFVENKQTRANRIKPEVLENRWSRRTRNIKLISNLYVLSEKKATKRKTHKRQLKVN